jgi:hypothetical protein
MVQDVKRSCLQSKTTACRGRFRADEKQKSDRLSRSGPAISHDIGFEYGEKKERKIRIVRYRKK